MEIGKNLISSQLGYLHCGGGIVAEADAGDDVGDMGLFVFSDLFQTSGCYAICNMILFWETVSYWRIQFLNNI